MKLERCNITNEDVEICENGEGNSYVPLNKCVWQVQFIVMKLSLNFHFMLWESMSTLYHVVA